MPILELPPLVALAVVATIGYLLGLRRSASTRQDVQKLSRHEMKRAEAVVRDLELISQEVRSGLAEHHASLLAFKNRLNQLSTSTDPDACQELAGEAELVLKPTLMLSVKISAAYEKIRQQTSMLLTFTELRTDPLTGLSNRRALDESLATRFALMGRYQAIFSLLIVDIDRFKQINDAHGHVHGDEVLRDVARIIQQSSRETDLIARYGGEEFVVVCPETDLAGSCTLARRICQAVERELPVTVSIGVAMALDGDTARSLIARADSALYSAKAGGRNRVYQHTGHHVLPLAALPGDKITGDLSNGNGTSEAEQQEATDEQPVG